MLPKIFIIISSYTHYLIPVMGFLNGSEGKESACNEGGVGSIPGSGRAPGGGNGNRLHSLAWKSPWTEEPGWLQSVGHKELDTTELLSMYAHCLQSRIQVSQIAFWSTRWCFSLAMHHSPIAQWLNYEPVPIRPCISGCGPSPGDRRNGRREDARTSVAEVRVCFCYILTSGTFDKLFNLSLCWLIK